MKNIILIGMPGSGKSTLGVVIAKIFGMDFIDTDVFIQKNENKKLQEIIDEFGTEAFLDTESKNIMNLNFENTVIATGGSAVLRENTMLHLKKNGITVFIDVSETELEKRIFNYSDRGIAGDQKSLSEIAKLRRPYYEKYADITVKTENLSPKESVEKIIKEIKNMGR